MHILDKIVVYKKQEVLDLKANNSYKKFERRPAFHTTGPSMKQSILAQDSGGIIAEFKKKSPSKQDINLSAEVIDVVSAYEIAGASGISVLTDGHFFGGHSQDLIQAASTTKLPVLRKDFIIDEFQIVESKSLGASIILLIARILTQEEMKSYTKLAHNLGMEVLVEIHNLKELDKCPVDMDIIGINNRDLDSFVVDYQRSIALMNQLPEDLCRISESGIHNTEVMIELRKAGFDGFLIGELFMRESLPGIACQRLIAEYKAKLQLG